MDVLFLLTPLPTQNNLACLFTFGIAHSDSGLGDDSGRASSMTFVVPVCQIQRPFLDYPCSWLTSPSHRGVNESTQNTGTCLYGRYFGSLVFKLYLKVHLNVCFAFTYTQMYKVINTRS